MTVLPGNILRVPHRFARGNFILATLDTVLKDEFWQNYGPDIFMIVNCIGVRYGRDKIQYPPGAAKASVFFINAHGPSLAEDFKRSCPEVERTLDAGLDVLVHCRETFHRSPAVWAGYQVAVCGHVDYQAFYS